MIFAQRLADRTFTGPESVHAQDKESKLCQPNATRLHDRILLCSGPVTMDAQHGWKRLLGLTVRNVGIGCHPHAGHRLEDNLLDTIAVADNLTQLTRFQWAWLRGKAAPRFQQQITKI